MSSRVQATAVVVAAAVAVAAAAPSAGVWLVDVLDCGSPDENF